ncbi:MAG: type VI secretion system ATPase TssH [Planctomycetes bacterium]|nr:type VI secretion system ATPase TssH [Planctomycetota bacterium]
MATTTSTADLRQLISRFDAPCIQFFQGATNLCASRTHFEIVPEHLLLRMLDDTTGDVTQIFNTFKVDRGQIRRAVQRILEEARSGHRTKPALSPKLVEMFQSASVMADEFGFAKIRPGLLILAFVLNPGHTRIAEFTPELDRIDVDQLRDHFHEIVLGTSAETAQAEAGAGPSPMAGDGNALAQFTIDLTAKAEGGDIDPVFGRDHEIRQMVDIFSRRRKNNPILVGDPGTGKTAIVEGLALRISKGDVPPVLQGVKLITLDLGLLQAGAGVKGEFENRLKNVINEIRTSETPIITFIDEAHTLIGAGGPAGGGDAANLLKPALARGELRTVAATTWAEYKKYFEKDAALERRFQLVRCDEPSVENTVVMLRGLKEKYEKHHKTIVLDEAIQAAAELSNRYISGRFLPDKAVDLLDTSAARVAIGLTTRPGPLEDLDRRLSHLETAINAVKRDAASGVAPETDVLEEMLETKESVIAERDALEVKWNAELEAVNHILELRSKLPSFQSDGDDGADEDQSGADGEGAVKEPAADAKPSVDVDALRKELAEAMKSLRESQGDAPLVHPHVDANTVAAVVGDWTGVPVGNMVKDEITAVLEMESRLAKRVVGQDYAVSIIAEKLRTAKSGLGNPQQPMGIFLCVGPSGVGKTEMALAISDLLFGGERFTVSINMSEYMEKHTVSQLKGSPPGYIGYGEGGVLTEAVRQRPYSVVLLDEIEKAHPDVLNLFYQVFDKGKLADGEGRVVDFKDTVFVLTSNIGTDAIQALCESGEDVTAEDLKEAVYPQLREHLKPALLARMTTIPFLTIGSDVMRMIAKLKVAKVAKRLAKAQNMRLEVDDSVYDKIVEQCDQVDIGARNIDRVLDQKILPVISRRLLERMTEDTMPTVLTMGTDASGEFTYTFSD